MSAQSHWGERSGRTLVCTGSSFCGLAASCQWADEQHHLVEDARQEPVVLAMSEQRGYGGGSTQISFPTLPNK